MLVGQGKKIEIWSAQQWEARRKEWLNTDTTTIDVLPVELQTLSL